MDSFTEDILSKARNRVNSLTYKNGNSIEATQSKVLSDKNVNFLQKEQSSISKDKCVKDSTKYSPQKTKTLSFQKENLNMEIKVTSSDDVRVEVEFEDSSNDEEPQPNGDVLRKDVKDRLNRLGKLYAGGEDANLSSPIHRTEEKFMSEDKSNDRTVINKHGGKLHKGLANLAEEINHWEDEIKTPAKEEKQALKWDKSVLESLESQGFQRNTKDSKLVYNYANNRNKDEKEKNASKTIKNSNTNVDNVQHVSKNTVAKTVNEPKTPRLQSNQRRISMMPDPSSLSLSERKALFEKNQGEVLLPKAPFAMSIPLNNNKSKTTANNSALKSNTNSPSTHTPRGNDSITNRIITLENIQLKKSGSINNSPSKTNENLDTRKPFVKSVMKKLDLSTTAETAKQQSKSVAFSKTGDKVNSPSKMNNFVKNSNESPMKAAVVQSGGIATTMEALFKKKDTISEQQIQSQVKEQRMKEMEVLMNRFNKKENREEMIEEEDEIKEENDTEYTLLNKEEYYTHTPTKRANEGNNIASPAVKRTIEDKSNVSPRRSVVKRTSVSPKVAAVLEDVKRVKVSPAKPGRIYPSLSDIETSKDTESEDTFEDSSPENSSIASNCGTLETSFGKGIMEAICKNQTPVKRAIDDDSTASDVSDVLGDMDEYLDEALEFDQEKECMGPTPPKQSKSKDSSFASNSFNYKSCSTSGDNKFRSPLKRRIPSERLEEAPIQVMDGQEVVPLTHTVSFYRKQTHNTASPSKKVSRQENETVPEPNKDEISAKIHSLQVEVQKLQLTIAQTSQALNLCNNTLEFMGSTEQVEAEKVLLVSTHRRQAILNEIQRLKVEETIRPQNHHQNDQDIPIEKGSLTISKIIFPLKKDYVRALAAAGGKGHHVLCLVKCGEEVVSSKLVSTVASNLKNPCYELTIPGSISLKNIYNDSTITLEVYCLQAQEELLPHELKYHIKKNKATPKKSKHESLLSRPIKESPGGPQAVRSSSFAQMGYVIFSVHKMNRKSWSLNNTPSMSPLEGSVEMIVSCELTASVEYRGFLTMFEDISGFGAWHRRWCLLKGDVLSYWKYPEDEMKIPPINSIDLKSCITKEFGPVSRDICARAHTFLIEIEREPLPQDTDRLTIIRKKNKTIVRHILSADTKEERIKWCSQLNTILLAAKLCGNNA